MKVLFVAGFGPIVSDMQESAAFYRDSLSLSFQEEADGYFHTENPLMRESEAGSE
jgi:catechol 2,3-dioxygenase-like lactoylglutathione lyase family enzyme